MGVLNLLLLITNLAGDGIGPPGQWGSWVITWLDEKNVDNDIL